VATHRTGISQEDARPVSRTEATAPANGPEELGVYGRGADVPGPGAPELRLGQVLAGEVAVDEVLIPGVAELHDEIVETFGESSIEQQLAQEGMLLPEPVHLDEGDDRRALEERCQPLLRVDRASSS
jgi:hypothetical protein